MDQERNKTANASSPQKNTPLTLSEERSLKVRKVFRRIPKTAAVIVLLLLICAIFSPLIAPHDPNEQNLADALKPPSWQQGGDP